MTSMDVQGMSRQELMDLAIRLAASIKQEDLEDPGTYGLLAQLVQLLDPKAAPLPQELVEALSQITDKAQMFTQAAQATSAKTPEELERLTDSMKSAGLLKSMYSDLEKVEKQDYSNSHILMFPVSIQGSHHPKPESGLPDYHVTLKVLGEHEHNFNPDRFREILDKHNPQMPKDIRVKPHTFVTPQGKTHHVLLLDHNMPELANAHAELSRHFQPDPHGFVPHITVEKEIHDLVKEKGLQGHHLNLKIHPLEYRRGEKTIAVIPPRVNELAYKSISEKLTLLKSGVEELSKGWSSKRSSDYNVFRPKSEEEKKAAKEKNKKAMDAAMAAMDKHAKKPAQTKAPEPPKTEEKPDAPSKPDGENK